MTREVRVFVKRMVCLVLALILTLSLSPGFEPNAQATGIALPFTLPAPAFLPFNFPSSLSEIYEGSVFQDIVEGDGYDALKALYTVTETASRATGFKYVAYDDMLGVSGIQPTEQGVQMMMQSISAVYNGLDEAEKSTLWQMAVQYCEDWKTGTQTILRFDDSMLSKMKGVLAEKYPAVSINNLGVNTIKGMTILEIFNQYGADMSYQNSSGNKFTCKALFFGTEKLTIYYEDTGLKLQHSFDIKTGITTMISKLYDNPVSTTEYDNKFKSENFVNPGLYIILRDNSYNVLMLHNVGAALLQREIMYAFDNLNDFTLTPPATTVDESKAISDIRAGVKDDERLAWVPPMIDPAKPVADAVAAVNNTDIEDLIFDNSPTEVDDDDKDKDVYNGAEELRELSDRVLNLTDELGQLEDEAGEILRRIDEVKTELDEVTQELERLRVLYEDGEVLTAEDIGAIAGRYGNLECVEASKAVVEELEKRKQKFEVIEIQYLAQGIVVSHIREAIFGIDNEQAYISYNGFHVGVLYNDLVYCNVHPYGLPIDIWLNDFFSFGTYTVIPSKYQNLKMW